MVKFAAFAGAPAAFALILGGCSAAPSAGDDDASPEGAAEQPATAGPCAERSGSYVASYTEKSGTCGKLADEVIVIGGSTTEAAVSACSGTVTVSDDSCTVLLDNTCPGAKGYLVSNRGKFVWAKDGANGSGEVQLTLIEEATGLRVCSSLYVMKQRRQ